MIFHPVTLFVMICCHNMELYVCNFIRLSAMSHSCCFHVNNDKLLADNFYACMVYLENVKLLVNNRQLHN